MSVEIFREAIYINLQIHAYICTPMYTGKHTYARTHRHSYPRSHTLTHTDTQTQTHTHRHTNMSDSAKSKPTKVCRHALILELTSSRRLGLGVCHQLDVKLGGYRSRLGESCVSKYTEKLWYNETVCVWIIYIYGVWIIYIYIYIGVYLCISPSVSFCVSMFVCVHIYPNPPVQAGCDTRSILSGKQLVLIQSFLSRLVPNRG